MTKILLAVYLNQMVRILWDYTEGDFKDLLNKVLYSTGKLDESDRQLNMVFTWTWIAARILKAILWPIFLVYSQISDIMTAYKSAKKKEED